MGRIIENIYVVSIFCTATNTAYSRLCPHSLALNGALKEKFHYVQDLVLSYKLLYEATKLGSQNIRLKNPIFLPDALEVKTEFFSFLNMQNNNIASLFHCLKSRLKSYKDFERRFFRFLDCILFLSFSRFSIP